MEVVGYCPRLDNRQEWSRRERLLCGVGHGLRHGPLDFQARAPVSPDIGALPATRTAVEPQATRSAPASTRRTPPSGAGRCAAGRGTARSRR